MYRYNGEYWYRDRVGLRGRLLMWFVHIGGWQMPHWTTAGYSYRWNMGTIRRALRARGHRSRLFAIYSSVCPLTFLGGRIVFQSFGMDLHARRTYYCLHYERERGRRQWYAYRSRNATPWAADTWYLGAPHEVVQAAQAQHDQMDASRREREQRKVAIQQ